MEDREGHKHTDDNFNSCARCRSGQLYGGGEKLKVLLALFPSALHLDFFAAAMPTLFRISARGSDAAFCHWTNENFGLFDLIMDSEPDAILTSRLGEADSISIPKAARRLGLDAYTLCTLIQRERVQAGLSPSGEFVIANEELNRLLKKD